MQQNPNEPMRHELVSWEDIDKIIDTLVPQMKSIPGGFDGIVMITRGGIIPGGLLAEALNLSYIMTAAVHFNDQYYSELPRATPLQYALPSFLQFPEKKFVEGRRLLLVDDVWGSGRTSTSIKGRLEAARAEVMTCVFHYNPYRSLFTDEKPNFYGEVTDAYITYPWEVDRGLDRMGASEPQMF